jgi:pSer/pThr/pTyr-binding forkhead associated (FHA) protein
VSHVYCPECGFQNPEAANYCARCGALIVKEESGDETTITFTPDEGEEDAAVSLEEVGIKGPALVVRSGGGRAGETFPLEGERVTVGRSPDCEIFLDDVTVSRKHAVLSRSDGTFVIADEGSLNGTFVNKRRVESAELEDGDELQIGKYRLTFLRG